MGWQFAGAVLGELEVAMHYSEVPISDVIRTSQELEDDKIRVDFPEDSADSIYFVINQ